MLAPVLSSALRRPGSCRSAPQLPGGTGWTV